MSSVNNLRALSRGPVYPSKFTVAEVTASSVYLNAGEGEAGSQSVITSVECADSYQPRSAGDVVWAIPTSPVTWLVLCSVTPAAL